MIDLIEDILEKVENSTGLQARWKPAHVYEKEAATDGYIELDIGKNAFKLPAEIKRTFYAYHLPPLMELKKHQPNLVLLAQNIPTALKQELKKAGIQYMDAAGNTFLQIGGNLIFVDGLKVELVPQKEKIRHFNKAGIKTVFALLIHDNLINSTIRNIAQTSDVSLDTAHRTIAGLKEQGYLTPQNKTTLTWNRKKELLDRWLTEYNGRLKPDLLCGYFRFINDDDFQRWQQLPLTATKTYWGGEAAGDLYTNYLKPAQLTLYTTESKPELMKNYRLRPDSSGKIAVFKKFWVDDDPAANRVPPLLAYADLMNQQDRRAIETAQKVYAQYLQDQF